MSTEYQPGEIVDITIRGARVVAPRHSRDTALTVAYEEISPGIWASVTIDRPDADSVTVDKVAGPDCHYEIELVDPDGAIQPYTIGTTVPVALRPLVRVYPAPDGGAL